MRINFVLPQVNLAGGIRVLAMYAQMLQRRGHAVTVRSVGAPRPGWRDWLGAWRRWRREGGRRMNPSHFDGLAVDHRVISPARPIEDGDVPDGDVVIATWWETAEWVAALSPGKGAKAHLLQHDESIFEHQPAARVRAAWRLPLAKIAVSRWLAQLAQQRAPQAGVYHVPNSVDTDLFHAEPRGKQPKPTVGLMYSRSHFKGVALANEAIARARAEVPDLRVVGFGMESPSRALPLPRGMHFELCPSQARLAALYQMADAWLFASRSEGFGLPVLEAMACRTPVIATPAGAAPDLLASGGGWLLDEIDDAAGMARAIVEMARLSEAHWRAVAEQTHATAQRYSWGAATDRLEAALRRIARGDRASASDGADCVLSTGAR